MGINGISTGYYPTGYTNNKTTKSAANGRTKDAKMNYDNAIRNNSVSKNAPVTKSSSFVCCHSAHVEYDTSLDYDSIMFGIYYEDGSSLQIYKSKEYTNENPLMDIYVRNPDGEWSKETINAKEIDLEHCSFAEMRVATAYLWETGVITDEWTYVQLSRANEEDRTVTYDDIFTPQNWLERVARWMKYQIDGGQYAAYQRFASLYSAFTHHQ